MAWRYKKSTSVTFRTNMKRSFKVWWHDPDFWAKYGDVDNSIYLEYIPSSDATLKFIFEVNGKTAVEHIREPSNYEQYNSSSYIRVAKGDYLTITVYEEYTPTPPSTPSSISVPNGINTQGGILLAGEVGLEPLHID